MCNSLFKHTTQNITPTIPNHAAGSSSPPAPASVRAHRRPRPASAPPSSSRSSRPQSVPTHSTLPVQTLLTPSRSTPASLLRIQLHLLFAVKRTFDPQNPLNFCSRSSRTDSTTFRVKPSSVRSLSSSPMSYSRRQVGHILLFALLLLYHRIFIPAINWYY